MATKHELEEMTKDELIAYADDRDIEVHHHWVKDEIITEIMKGEKKIAREEAKQDTTEQATKPVEKQDPTVKVDPKLAALQARANAPQNQSTPEEKKDE